MDEMKNLLEVMAALRDPERGCPWDREQSFATIAPYTIEEAYEVADAIERGDLGELRAELGDLLLQVVFHARMAEEQGAFDFADVARGIAEKLVRRHPHVFVGEEAGDDAAQHARWEAIKAEERAAAGDSDASALAGVARALPALKRAQKLGRRAARVGFDWPDGGGARAKIDEELAELDAELAASGPDGRGEGESGTPARVAEELGDLLFAVVNLARHAGVDAEAALEGASRRFERRFRAMERALAAQGRALAECEAETLDKAWEAAKRSV